MSDLNITGSTSPLVIINYSHNDESWGGRLYKLLNQSVEAQNISIWNDRLFVIQQWHSEIRSGIQQWHSVIQANLSQAKLAVLLVSADYLASEWVTNEEVHKLLEAAQQRGLRIFPILLRPCKWEAISWLKRIQPFPKDGKPIMGREGGEQDRLLKEAADQVVKLAIGTPSHPPSQSRSKTANAYKPPSTPPSPAASTDKLGSSSSLTRSVGSKDELLPIEELNGQFDFSRNVKELTLRARSLASFMVLEPPQVTISCLLLTMAEMGRAQLEPFTTAQFFWRELEELGKDKYLSLLGIAFPKASYSSTDGVIDYTASKNPALLIRSDLLGVLGRAESISKQTTHSEVGSIHTRHLFAALLDYKPDGGSTGAAESLSGFGMDVQKLRERFFQYISDTLLPTDDINAWRTILLPEETSETTEEVAHETPAETPSDDENFRAPLAGFLTDYWLGEDLLGITSDVNALASLVAAWTVEPPLSIGLFGDWGSGKTHFMRQMKVRVEKLSRRARAAGEPQNKIGYYKNIVQIEFNAWHYIEGNLWASLVEHIFQNLRMSKEDDEEILKKRQEELLNKLLGEENAKQEADKAVELAEEKVKTKQEEIEEIERQQKEKIENLSKLSKEDILAGIDLRVDLDSQTRHDIDEVLKAAGVGQVGHAARDIQAALAEAQSVLVRGSKILTPILKAADRKKRFVSLLIILIGAPVLGLIIALLTRWLAPQISNLSAVVGGVATLLTTGAHWIRQQVAWMSEWSQRVEKMKQKVDKQVDEQKAQVRAEHAEQIASHQQELKVLQTKLDASLRELAAAQRRVEEIKAEIKQSSAVQRLGKFIQDRAASDDYRKHLGVLALIRRDFEKLADLFSQQREEERKGNGASDDETINRIILYIDDLDRCPPERVVQVLQAIHLLLAFPLFVVVVGVDARWVTRSLQESYEWLRGEEEDEIKDDEAEDEQQVKSKPQSATPHDYLEKIFQIPFWLKPMEDDACKNLLEGLTKESRDDSSEKQVEGSVKPSVVQTRAEAKKIDTVKVDQKIFEAEQNQEPPTEVASMETSVLSYSSQQASAVAGGFRQREPLIEIPGDAAKTGVGIVSDAISEATGGNGKPDSSRNGEGASGNDDEEIDLEPQSLKLSDKEIKYMKELTPLIGRSPRSVKRFLNCYRLIKVGMRPAQLKTFLGKHGRVGEYEAVMILLGIITGAPSISLYFIEQLEKYPKKEKPGSLHSFLDDLDYNPEIHSQPDWTRVKEFLQKHISPGEDSVGILSTLIAITPRVSRYSFRVARVEGLHPRRSQTKGKRSEPSPEKA